MINNLSTNEFNLIYNTFSFTFAIMAAATMFFWLCRKQVAKKYRIAITITGLVTFIAAYHYLQIFLSFNQSYDLIHGVVTSTGHEFNNAYRYVDWLLTVPLLMVELILVMNLSADETVKKSTTLGVAAAIMIILGYPGEISSDLVTRWLWWILAMIPFLYIVYNLFFGLRASIDQQPEQVKPLVKFACVLTVIAWSFYPIVFLLPMFGFETGGQGVGLQVGYSLADIIAKVVFGFVIFLIAYNKSSLEK